MGSSQTPRCARLASNCWKNIRTSRAWQDPPKRRHCRTPAPDFVVAGQAFHWFEPSVARAEFVRILRPKGWVALIGTSARTATRRRSQREYEAIAANLRNRLRAVAATYPERQRMADFFGRASSWRARCRIEQLFDFEGLRGRLLSSSYSPPTDMNRCWRSLKLFDAHQENGACVRYETHIYYGRL